MDDVSVFPLLQLPGPCLLAVLQCCAEHDQRSLFSAARAHSRLHQAAVVALSSITAVLPPEQNAHSVMLYLGKHGRHVAGLELKAQHARTASLRQLSPLMQLSSLQLDAMMVQLHPRNGFQGVMEAATALKQLRLSDCKLIGSKDGLAAALSQLPSTLEHLSISCPQLNDDLSMQFPKAEFLHLQHLTHLELASSRQQLDMGPLAQSLLALTGLVDLRLAGWESISASTLSCTPHLTRLELSCCYLEPDALAGKTQLQHLGLRSCTLLGCAAGTALAQLLSQLQHPQQLTHLSVHDSVNATEVATSPTAEAFSALVASPELHHLEISSCTLPAATWQHLFSAGRQLSHLRSLNISAVSQPHRRPAPDTAASASAILLQRRPAPALEGTRLVRCCPSLECLTMQNMAHNTKLLTSLQALSSLHTLRLGAFEASAGAQHVEYRVASEEFQAVGQLAGLRELCVSHFSIYQPELLYLTQLKQLTVLEEFVGPSCDCRKVRYICKGLGEEPGWRQLLRLPDARGDYN